MSKRAGGGIATGSMHRLLVERRSSTRGCRSSRGINDFSAISLQNFTKLTHFNLDTCPNLSVKGHQNRTSLWLFFRAPMTTLYTHDYSYATLGNVRVHQD